MELMNIKQAAGIATLLLSHGWLILQTTHSYICTEQYIASIYSQLVTSCVEQKFVAKLNW